jgi:fatty-acyl-CoA synthase
MTTSDEAARQFSRRAWTRAMERTASLSREPTRTLPVLIDEWAAQHEDRPALECPSRTLTYRGLAEQAHRYARWAIAEGIAPGEVIALLMGNIPEYLAIWLGLTRVGITVALINTQLRGALLAHPIRAVSARAIIFESRFAEAMAALRPALPTEIDYWVHGEGDVTAPRIDEAAALLPSEPLPADAAPLPHISDRALYIYTSGTTGLPKAAIVSHLRLLQWSQWFAGLIDTQPTDRMYDCLPLYHSIGGIVAPGATLAGGGTVVLRDRFSATGFWRDVVESRCTLFQYIGELCRYLLQVPTDPIETSHSLRLCCGNGLTGAVWTKFQERFRIPQILEYYAATEGSFSLYNCEGRPGSIGRIPPFLAHRLPVALVQYDPDTELPLRDDAGRCVRCGVDEPGEALGQIRDAHGKPAGHFEGYADEAATKRKLLHDVFEPGDCWYRTGDLMRQDAQGFFYFVDRVGDTFRWQGENVSTTEVAAVLTAIPGVLDAVVYGVVVPGAEGRAGMAALVVDDSFDWISFARLVTSTLPAYAQPLFARLVPAIELTGTFRRRKQDFVAAALDPAYVQGPLFFLDRAHGRYSPLDSSAPPQ